jgi:hypothetical protein
LVTQLACDHAIEDDKKQAYSQSEAHSERREEALFVRAALV